MKKILLAVFTLLSLTAGAQTDDLRTKINQIKRDSSYLYGEATMPTKEEALTLAKDFLCSYIEQWVNETRDAQNLRSIVVKDLVADCDEVSLMRGNMYRAFAYVRKSDLYAVDTHTVSIPVDKAADGAGAGVASEPVAQSAPPTAEVPAVPAAPAQPVASAAETLWTQLCRDLCARNNVSEVKQLLETSPYASACSSGVVNQNSDPRVLEKSVLVIFKSATQAVQAFLGPKDPKRKNLKTTKEDSTVNYPGCQAMWISLK